MVTVLSDLLAVCMASVAVSPCPHVHTHRHRHIHRPVHHDPPPPMQTAVASWYELYGVTASGWSATYGFASLIFGSEWGKRVMFCYQGRCQVGILDDHGPYVAGRTFDLSPALRAALGCPDLCTLRWRVV
jgi:hypothetical protein